MTHMAHKILILEDNTLLAMLIEDTLETAGFGDYVLCKTEQAALDYMTTEKPAFALLDFNLGDKKDSIKVAKALRDANVPFFFLTGYAASLGIIPENLGEAKIINKPFKPAHLAKLIKQQLAVPQDSEKNCQSR